MSFIHSCLIIFLISSRTPGDTACAGDLGALSTSSLALASPAFASVVIFFIPGSSASASEPVCVSSSESGPSISVAPSSSSWTVGRGDGGKLMGALFSGNCFAGRLGAVAGHPVKLGAGMEEAMSDCQRRNSECKKVPWTELN